MKKIPCQYVLVRFAPYVETGEFANIGILMMAPKQGYFGYMVETRGYKRVTQFFNELAPEYYKKVRQSCLTDLKRAHEVLKNHGFNEYNEINDINFAKTIFSEVVRPRENIIRFSSPRFILAEDPGTTLLELFSFYVERNFVTKTYKEALLENGIRALLTKESLNNRFHRKTIGNTEYQATFPFVEFENSKPIKIIKPLHLAQTKASEILDHGGTWLFRLEELRRRHTLPENVLFTVAGPETTDASRQQAFADIVGRLKETGVEVIDYLNLHRVIEFARGRITIAGAC